MPEKVIVIRDRTRVVKVGVQGPQGPAGAAGAAGPGVAAGGTTGQILTKASTTNHDTIWSDPSAINTVTWDNVTGKPAPVTNLSGVNTGDQDLSGYETSVHAAATYARISHTHPWSQITSTPTTLAGYGITDGITAAAVAASYAPLASPALTGTPTAPTPSQSDNSTKLATTAFVQALATSAVAGLLKFKGMTDCSTNPDYPAASIGHAYIVSVAGKIGGASGTAVDIGDWYIATADNAGGTEAAVGTSWGHLEHNLVGALLTSNNLSDLANAATARTNLGLGTLATQNGTFSGTSSGTNTGDQDLSGYSTLAGDNTFTGLNSLRGHRPTNAQTGTSYTLVAGDAGKRLKMTNASGITLTVPPASSVAWVADTEIDVQQNGAGQVTITPGAGVTINSKGSLTKTSGQYGVCTLKYEGSDVWTLAGGLA